MTLTGAQLLEGFEKFLGSYWKSTTTTAGNAGGTTLVDTLLSRFGDDKIRDWYLRPLGAANQYVVRRISGFTSSTGTITVGPAFAAQTATSQEYMLHRYDPALLFRCLNEARMRVFPDLCILRYVDTATGDGRTRVFDIPSTIRRGPVQVLEETPIECDARWNFITSPLGDSTSSWTASNFTASTVTRDDTDLLIPKYDSTCTKLVASGSVNATYTQAVSAMSNDITAAKAAGRQMTFAMWVYTRTGSKVTLEITDDGATSSSSVHGGSGWELLTVTKDIVSNNATTLTVGVDADNDSSPVVVYWNRAWLYFGPADRVENIYYTDSGLFVRRDDSTQKVYLDWAPRRGHQLRMIGRDVISAITSETSSVEIDEESAQVLYAEAARTLFAMRGLSTDDFPEVGARLQLADQLRTVIRRQWQMSGPQPRAMKGPWSGN